MVAEEKGRAGLFQDAQITSSRSFVFILRQGGLCLFFVCGHLFIGGSDRPEVACLEMGRFHSVITADSLSYNVTCFPFWIRYPSCHVIFVLWFCNEQI